MTTSAAPGTSNKEITHATRTDDGKTNGDAPAGHGGCFEGTGTRYERTRTELSGAARTSRGSAVDVARESSAGAALARRQTQGRGGGRHRLSRVSRAG